MTAADFAELLRDRDLRARKARDGYEAQCPAHNDQRESLSFADGHKGLVVTCHAGCRREEVVAALGLKMSDLFHDNGSRPTPLTLAEFAAAKGLPAPFLSDCGVLQDDRGLCMTYRLIDGTPAPRQRRRTAIVAKDGSTWDGQKGKAPVAYGLWRLEEALVMGELVIVEGETDTLTAWYHNVPCLGIPGADMAKLLTDEALAYVARAGATLWIVKEPGRSGETFVAGIAKRLAEYRWLGQAMVITLPVKDLNELHLSAGERFADEFAQAKASATPLDQAVRRPPSDAAATTDELRPDSGGLHFTPLGELLAEPEEACAWLVERRLPAGGLSVLAGKPKAGKSTLARCLALAVARGEPWLGFPTSQGPVLYLALEEKRAEVRKHFRAMGAHAGDAVRVFVEASPKDGLAKLQKAAERERPALIIVDPLFRFVRVRDANDYALVTAALEPLMILARQTGAHVLTAHHHGKGERSGGDAILGSTAIFGAVDTALLLKRSEQYRTLSSIQRYGDDLGEITLTLDEETRVVKAGPPRAEADEAEMATAILDYLMAQPEPVEERAILDEVEGRKALKVKALRRLVAAGKVDRAGAGKKGDTYRYSVSCSLVPTYRGEQENKNPKSGLSGESGKTYSCSGQNRVSGDEPRSREQGSGATDPRLSSTPLAERGTEVPRVSNLNNDGRTPRIGDVRPVEEFEL